MEGEEAQKEQLPDGWEESDVDDVEKTIPEQAGQDRPVEFVPTHQTRRGTVFGKKTTVVHADNPCSDNCQPHRMISK